MIFLINYYCYILTIENSRIKRKTLIRKYFLVRDFIFCILFTFINSSCNNYMSILFLNRFMLYYPGLGLNIQIAIKSVTTERFFCLYDELFIFNFYVVISSYICFRFNIHYILLFYVLYN